MREAQLVTRFGYGTHVVIEIISLASCDWSNTNFTNDVYLCSKPVKLTSIYVDKTFYACISGN